jgi:hypothetical protein
VTRIFLRSLPDFSFPVIRAALVYQGLFFVQIGQNEAHDLKCRPGVFELFSEF